MPVVAMVMLLLRLLQLTSYPALLLYASQHWNHPTNANQQQQQMLKPYEPQLTCIQKMICR